LSKMGRVMPFAASRGWVCWALWTGGITLRWVANVAEWYWRVLLPASAALQLAGFLIFFATVSRHQSRPASAPPAALETWMKLVMASTAGFLLALLMNLVVSIDLAMTSMHPEIPHWLDPTLSVSRRLGVSSPGGMGLQCQVVACLSWGCVSP